jgi:hypothetical protein
MQEQPPIPQTPVATPTPTPTPPKSSKSRVLLFAFLGIALMTVLSIIVLSDKENPEPEIKSSPPKSISQPPTQTPAPTIPTTPLPKQTTWKLFKSEHHRFVAPDRSFLFSYQSGWVYEIIDGNTPQQQHIAQLGRERSQQEREQLAEQAGIPLTDTLSGIGYTSQEFTLYYTDAFQTGRLEDLATGTILSKKYVNVAGTPAIEATVDCPTECIELLFVKGKYAFTFILAKPLGSEAPLDTTPIKRVESSFTYL